MVTGADLYWVTRMDGLRDTVFDAADRQLAEKKEGVGDADGA